MNIHQYLLPATLAATVHVALLWFLPAEPYVRIIEVPLVTAKPPIPEPVPEPPEDSAEPLVTTDPVKPLAGQPAPPELDDVIPARLPDDIFTIVADHRPHRFDTAITTLPTGIGPEGLSDGFGVNGPHILSPGDLDRVPRAKVQLPPDYPYAMKQSGTGGSVLVEFDVNAEGRVVRAEAVRYSDRGFAEPAVRAVRKWQFEPGRRHGKAVPFRMTVPIEFGVENN